MLFYYFKNLICKFSFIFLLPLSSCNEANLHLKDLADPATIVKQTRELLALA